LRTHVLIGCVCILTTLVAGLHAGQLAPKLEAALQDASSDALIPVIVQTRVQGDLQSLPLLSSYDDKVAYLRAAAADAQQDMLNWLQTVRAENVRPLWLVSRVALHAPRSVILDLAARQDVATVWLDDTFRLDVVRPNRVARDATDGPTWNIDRVKADSCWADGYDGTGIVVGNIDTGVEVTHPAFGGRWREENGWFDAVSGLPTPYDDATPSHGTVTMGLLTGGDGLGSYQHDIGVAPGATFIAAKAFDAGGNSSQSWTEQCLNWMADPGRPDVLSNSWGDTMQDTFCMASIGRLRDLGMIVVFSAGNNGPWPATVGTPGCLPTVICVGATDSLDDIAGFSSRGPAPDRWPWNEPAYWSRPDWDLICPAVVAPGETVMSAVRGDTFAWYPGTSVACPQVAGCCALLKQKYPSLTHDEVMQMITNGADRVPQGGSYPNNDYGWGRLNCRRALDTLPSPVRPFVRVDAVWVMNDENHNDTLEPGETGDLVLRLRNSGRFDATNLRGVLRGANTMVSILDSTTNVGLLPALDTANTSGDPFVLHADPACPLGYIPDLTLALTCNETTWTYPIPLRVGASGKKLWGAHELRSLPGSPYTGLPSGLAYNLVDNRLYVTCSGTSFIHIYSSDSLVELVDSIWAPDSNVNCYDLAFSPGDTTFWVLSYYVNEARVSKLQPDGTVLRHFHSPAATWPAGITWDEGVHRLYQVESQYEPPSLIHVTDTLGGVLDTIPIPLGGSAGAYCLTREVTRGNPFGSALVNAYEFYVAGRPGPDSAGVYMLRSDNGAVIARFLVQPPDSGYYGYHISGVEYDPRDASYWVTFFSRSAPYHMIAKYSGFYPVGISEEAAQRPFPGERNPRFRPNPCRTWLNIDGPGAAAGIDRAEFYNVAGRCVAALPIGPARSIDVRPLAPSVYFLRVTSGVGSEASSPTKVVISR
jgi:subtilisin family serine protease